MDSEELNNFYVTLPSNSSHVYFPKNTHSSFRTKLSSPLTLNGNWDVGLSEIVIPRNWFNVNEHNNSYTVTYKTEELVKSKYLKHKIELNYDVSPDIFQFCESVNNAIGDIIKDKASVIFLPREAKLKYDTSQISIALHDGFEIEIKKNDGNKLLYMLNLKIEDKIINLPHTFKYRPSTQSPLKIVFYVFNKNPKGVHDHLISNVPIKDDLKLPLDTVTDMINVFHTNLKLLELQDFVEFPFDATKMEFTVSVVDTAEVMITNQSAPLLLKKLSLDNVDEIVIKDKQTFKVNPKIEIQLGEAFYLRIYDYYETLDLKTHYEELKLNVGMYKSPDDLFKAFQHVHFDYLPDSKVLMRIPVTYEVSLARGLADMLGFENTTFSSGVFISKYPLELDGGITEIFVYSDLVSSHHVGDTFSPLLRIIPCVTEKSDQIVKSYQRPLYFPIRKSFVETIKIDLKTSSGNNNVFSGGKTYVVLSFRRRKLV